jgi:hypothetical protein
VRDLDSAITWYKEKFGLMLGPALDEEIGNAQLQSQDEQVTVVLSAPEKAGDEMPMLSTKKAQKAREWLTGTRRGRRPDRERPAGHALLGDSRSR